MVRPNVQFRREPDDHFGGESSSAPALLALTLDRSLREPLGQQLFGQLRELILAGAIAPDARLPSTRAMAGELGVSRMVTLSAYDQLIAEGYVAARRGAGVFVERLVMGVHAAPAPPASRPAPIATPPRPASAAPFSLAGQNTAAFPHAAWARLLARGWRRWGAEAALEDPAGLPALRGAVARWVQGLRGAPCTAEQVLITAGAGESLALIGRMLPPERSRAWVEDPGYRTGVEALGGGGAQIVPVPVDGEGLVVAEGRRRAPDAALAMVTPARQFPTGAPMSLTRRLALVEWAREADAILVEDDYDSEIRFAGRPLASLASLDPHRVLRLESFSKMTFPGLRLGAVIGPPELIGRLTALRARRGQSASVAQPALAEFLDGGGMARHLRGLRKVLAARRAALIEALESRLGEALEVRPQQAGRHLLATLRPGLAARMDDVTMAARAEAAGLTLEPLSRHYLQAEPTQGLLFGYAAWDEAAIRAGVEVLAGIVS